MTDTFDVAVYVGRMQPFLNSHLAGVRRALQLAPACVVVVAGGYQARSPRNPLGRQQRSDMLHAALTAEERARVRVVAVRDDCDPARLAGETRRQIEQVAGRGRRVVVVNEPGCRLPALPGWPHAEAPVAPPADVPLRERLFDAADPRAVLQRHAHEVAPGTEAFWDGWLASAECRRLADEWRALRGMRAEWAGAPYPPTFVTVDSVVHCAGHVLVITRGREPGKGLHALPGGFLEPDDTVLDSAVRELAEETGLAVPAAELRERLQQVRVFDDPLRSQRGRVLTHAHYFELGARALPAIRAGDDAAAAFWLPLAEVAAREECFHDDHFLILDAFLHVARPHDVPAPALQ